MVFRRGPGPGPAGYIHAQMEGAVNIRIGDSKDLRQYDPAIG